MLPDHCQRFPQLYYQVNSLMEISNNTITPFECVQDALALRIPAYIPFHAYESPEHAMRQLGLEVHEMYLDPSLLPQAMINTAKLYRNDVIYMRFGPDIPEDQTVREMEDHLAFINKKTGEIESIVLRDTKTILPRRLAGPLVSSLNDIDRIDIVPCETLLQMPDLQSLQPYIKAFQGERFLFGFACAQSANALYSYLGNEEAMLATMEDPGLCKAVMERKYLQLKEMILALKQIGADGVYTGDACASCSFYSPATYRDLFWEYQKRSIDFVHELGMKTLLHICGRTSAILEDMAATGADVIESLDAPSAGGDVVLKEAKKRVGNNVCLKGNLDAVHLLEPGSADKIYEAATQAMYDAGPDGYILSTEQITRDTPREHVFAMIQARDDFTTR